MNCSAIHPMLIWGWRKSSFLKTLNSIKTRHYQAPSVCIKPPIWNQQVSSWIAKNKTESLNQQALGLCTPLPIDRASLEATHNFLKTESTLICMDFNLSKASIKSIYGGFFPSSSSNDHQVFPKCHRPQKKKKKSSLHSISLIGLFQESQLSISQFLPRQVWILDVFFQIFFPPRGLC